MVIDRDMIVISCGRSLNKLYPDLEGKKFIDFFHFKRQRIAGDLFEALSKNLNQLIILQVLNDPEMIFRGEFEYIVKLDQLLFFGSPWLPSGEWMTQKGLAMTDFAIHDHVPDLMMALKTQQDANEDIISILEQLKIQKEELKKTSSIIESYPHPVIITHPDHTIIWVNDAFTKEMNYTLEEVKGQSPEKFLFEDYNNKFVTSKIKNYFRKGQNFTQEILTKNKAGQLFWVNLQGHAVKNTMGNLIQYFFIQQNIQPQKEAEKKIQDSLQKEILLSEMKSKFVAMASHEFRTPMTVIQLQVELIELWIQKNKPEEHSWIHSPLAVIEKEIERLTHLISDILMVGKVNENDLIFEKQELSIVEILKENIERFNGLQKEQDSIQLTVYGEPRLGSFDKNKMSHILDNLISNAIKFSKGALPPVIKLYFQDDCFKVSIKDFGIGIPLQDQEKIFNSFFRGANTINFQGSGIGMFIVQRFVELHKGKITFTSVENEGTEFILTIPY
jgi:PAS domain S-box-containing protein